VLIVVLVVLKELLDLDSSRIGVMMGTASDGMASRGL
jgi:hypothetical protein